MFTGLIEACGQVTALEPSGEQARLRIAAPFAHELSLGDSVAINGCCLTAVEIDADSVAFDVLTKTLEVTSLGDLATGHAVNLERALKLGDRLGGHFVQGHIDATGTIESLEPRGQDHVLSLRLPAGFESLCILKGSLAIDGISLTIAELDGSLAQCWIIPHTFSSTNLHQRATGQRVNLEFDMLAKHIARLVACRES